MTNTLKSISRTLMIPLALATLLILATSAAGQNPAGGLNLPVVQDWSTHHVVFSDPGKEIDAIRSGNYERWLKIVNDPRYIMQQQRRSVQAGAGVTPEEPLPATVESRVDATPDPLTSGHQYGPQALANEMTLEDRDALRGGNRNVPGGLVRALIPPSGPAADSGTIPIDPLPNRMKNDWSENMGSGGTVGLGDFPATFSTGSGTSCADFAVFNTGLTGSSTQASIIGYQNLYSSHCSPSPQTYWAYNTGGTITNGIDLSLDGSQVGFVQAPTSGNPVLVLLKWASCSTCSITAPVTPTTVSNANYRNSCTPLPCMTTITFSGTMLSDTYSFPYYDYGSDTIYVGDDQGHLHKFTGVFLGTPAEVTTSPWPVTVNAESNGDSALGSPVYDSASGNIFVGDYLLNTLPNCAPGVNTGIGTCGYLYSVNSSGTPVHQSAQLDYNIGVLDSPLVDSSGGLVYAFAGDDGSTNCTVSGVAQPCAGVFQFSTTFGAGATGTEAKVGAGYEFMMSGAFDNEYLTSMDPPTGHLYVVGNTGPVDNTVYQILISSGAMSTVTTGPEVATNYDNGYYAAGLQVTEFYNTGTSTDNIFLSVLAFGTPTSDCNGTFGVGLNNGCVMGFNLNGFSGSSTPTGGLSEAGGTSGIVVDNGTSGGNIYFSTLLNSGTLNETCGTSGGTGGCAVQTGQTAP